LFDIFEKEKLQEYAEIKSPSYFL